MQFLVSLNLPRQWHVDFLVIRTTPGRWKSLGSFCVINRYMNAAEIMNAIRHPAP
ncbi:hypothetical protein CH063_09536 [Colletotrichum higginsianum]|uniref:Uncharacterized protein n=1 Tax=Colletotrichum higginsianum (strain IMI 349063) TaxID=759273 RepID=H1VDZ8_COLHI|nr:hypothetical protein CH063_09536 [Colletotrichum higginsianum]